MTLFADRSRDALRATWREAWRKWRERVPLQPLEVQIADVVAEHPEYHTLLQSDAAAQDPPSQGAAEHRMIEVLAGVWREAQRGGHEADQSVYFERLRRL